MYRLVLLKARWQLAKKGWNSHWYKCAGRNCTFGQWQSARRKVSGMNMEPRWASTYELRAAITELFKYCSSAICLALSFRESETAASLSLAPAILASKRITSSLPPHTSRCHEATSKVGPIKIRMANKPEKCKGVQNHQLLALTSHISGIWGNTGVAMVVASSSSSIRPLPFSLSTSLSLVSSSMPNSRCTRSVIKQCYARV